MANPTSTTLDRLTRAALELAVSVDIDDRLATDPTFHADRSPRADRLRSEARAQALAEYRAATIAHREAVAA